MKTLNIDKSFSFRLAFIISAIFLSFSHSAMADEEFYGRIESRPSANIGIWIISGQQVEVTESSEIENDNGPLVIGSCVEVEHKKGVVKEIESAKPRKCEGL